MSAQMQSVLSTQNVALPTGFAKPKKFVNKPTLMFSDEQEEWVSFLSSAQIEMWGSERYEQHPMNSLFKLYQQELWVMQDDNDPFYDTSCCPPKVSCSKCNPDCAPGTKQTVMTLDELCNFADDDDDEQMDVCGYTECENDVPEYLDEETGDLIDGRDEYCSDTCREAQSVLEDEEMQEFEARLPSRTPKRELDATLTYWQRKISKMMFIHDRVHPVAKIMKRPSSLALASLLSNYYPGK
jgi:hypothetical protein